MGKYIKRRKICRAQEDALHRFELLNISQKGENSKDFTLRNIQKTGGNTFGV